MLAGFVLMVIVGFLPSVTGQVYGDDPKLAIIAALGLLCFAVGIPLALLSGLWILVRLTRRQLGVRSE